MLAAPMANALGATAPAFGKPGSKGAKKGGPMIPGPPDVDSWQAIQELLPLVSGIIDENKGVLNSACIGQHNGVRALLGRIKGHKGLGKLLGEYKDYFVQFEGGYVGTAAGYDSGLIRPDGTLNMELVKANHKSNKNLHPGPPKPKNKRPHMMALAPAVAPSQSVAESYSGGSSETQLTLMQTLSEFNLMALYNPDDNGLYQLFAQIQAARHKARQENAFPEVPSMKPLKGQKTKLMNMGGLTPAERDERKAQILRICIEELRKQPTRSLGVHALVQHEQVAQLKRGAIGKFVTFLQDHSDVFEVTQIPDTPQWNVVLLEQALKRQRM